MTKQILFELWYNQDGISLYELLIICKIMTLVTDSSMRWEDYFFTSLD